MTNNIETSDGTMRDNAEVLADVVVGRRIVAAERIKVESRWYGSEEALVLTLDSGQRVRLRNTADCCAYTELREFLLHPDKVEHVITGVSTEDDFQKWHIFADMGDVLELTVGWSEGNPYYYAYGFEIEVV